jgi:glycosyltransferase involved in cell wall biosynthesis
MNAPAPLHVVSLATLFPDATRPNFGVFVERSLAALARQPGVALTIVAPVGVPPWPLSRHPRYADLARLPRAEQWHGLTVLRPRFRLLPGIGARRHPAAIARSVLPILRELRAQGRCDVIDAQFFFPDGPAARRLSQATGLPYSIKARGADISLWAQRADTAPAIRAAAADAGGLLAVAASLKEDMVAAGMPAERIAIHYTGLDAARFRPQDRTASRADWQAPAGARILLSVGALIPRKGQALVVQALAALPDDVHYWLAGKGEDKAALRALAERLGVASRVRFLGSVPHDRLPALYAVADAMVLPSASEGLANAWVEALGCGTPLILSDIAPARELVALIGAGRVAQRTPDAIAAAITAQLAAPVEREALAQRTHARFDWDRNGAELAAHLRAVAAAVPSGPAR